MQTSPLEEALEIPADDAGGDVELAGELRLDPAPGETAEFVQASQDGPLPDSRPQVADRIDFPTSGTPGTGLLPADWGRPRNVRHFFPLAAMSDKQAPGGAPARAPAAVAVVSPRARQDDTADPPTTAMRREGSRMKKGFRHPWNAGIRFFAGIVRYGPADAVKVCARG
jgi:hypothetical protein